MRDVVVRAARAFQTRYEGRCPFMYIDQEGLVTTGIGNLIDPAHASFGLHWLRADGSTATLNAVQDEWIRVKDRQDLRGAPISQRQAIATLHLDDAEINHFFDAETSRMWGQIVAGYPDAETWPAGAQLGTLSMTWAMGAGRIVPGPSFQYAHFRAAALAKSWGICAQECKMNGVGIDGRNVENKALFLAACGSDLDALPV